MNDLIIGKQDEGTSPESIKKMAIRAILSTKIRHWDIVADIGAGRGDFTRLFLENAGKIIMMDSFSSPVFSEKVSSTTCDLNGHWDAPDNHFSLAVSLEVVEHIENPRHFFREIFRILKPGGYGFVSTPHNLDLIARIFFFATGVHRYFQDQAYPAHISALMPIDVDRILKESKLEKIDFYYNYLNTLPLFKKNVNIKSKHFSSSIGVLFRKPLL